jgi:hypothetical protein
MAPPEGGPEQSVCASEAPAAYAHLLAKLFEVVALRCGGCSSPMKVLALITDPA